MSALSIDDYLSSFGFALLGFDFINVIVTFTLSTVVLFSIAFAKAARLFYNQ